MTNTILLDAKDWVGMALQADSGTREIVEKIFNR